MHLHVLLFNNILGFLLYILNSLLIKLKLRSNSLNSISQPRISLETKYLININVENLLLSMFTSFLLDLVKVMAGILNLTVNKILHLLGNLRIFFLISLQDGARPPVYVGEEQIHILTSADHGMVLVVSVHHREAGGPNYIEREPDYHLSRAGLLWSIQLPSVDVLMVKSNPLTVRQLPNLLNGFKPQIIILELVSEAR